MLTMRVRYAIRALTALARYPVGHPVLVRIIANSEGIPHRFLNSILVELRNQGLVTSHRGRGGGYSLRMSADQITVETLLSALERRADSDPCVGIYEHRVCNGCKGTSECGARLVVERAHLAILTALQGITIAELAGDSRGIADDGARALGS